MPLPQNPPTKFPIYWHMLDPGNSTTFVLWDIHGFLQARRDRPPGRSPTGSLRRHPTELTYDACFSLALIVPMQFFGGLLPELPWVGQAMLVCRLPEVAKTLPKTRNQRIHRIEVSFAHPGIVEHLAQSKQLPKWWPMALRSCTVTNNCPIISIQFWRRQGLPSAQTNCLCFSLIIVQSPKGLSRFSGLPLTQTKTSSPRNSAIDCTGVSLFIQFTWRILGTCWYCGIFKYTVDPKPHASSGFCSMPSHVTPSCFSRAPSCEKTS